jgi:hypothetical protein
MLSRWWSAAQGIACRAEARTRHSTGPGDMPPVDRQYDAFSSSPRLDREPFSNAAPTSARDWADLPDHRSSSSVDTQHRYDSSGSPFRDHADVQTRWLGLIDLMDMQPEESPFVRCESWISHGSDAYSRTRQYLASLEAPRLSSRRRTLMGHASSVRRSGGHDSVRIPSSLWAGCMAPRLRILRSGPFPRSSRLTMFVTYCGASSPVVSRLGSTVSPLHLLLSRRQRSQRQAAGAQGRGIRAAQ